MTDSETQTKKLWNVIGNCLDLDNPKSLFLFAGAGTGKTRALVKAMQIFRQKYGEDLRFSARKAGVITYTNAASDEIKQRIDNDPIFIVSTIHSFAWKLIQSFHSDIKEWLRQNLEIEINELKEKQKRGRRGSKAFAERIIQIQSKRERLNRLNVIRHFTYNPNGENIGKNSLNHAEVISISTFFLGNKPLMQRLLIRQYPVLLIDESQDTQKDLIDAFFKIQQKYPDEFCLALFGDTMQRIYFEGKVDLGKSIPENWEKPALTVNHRSPKRIVKLINSIRSQADGMEQQSRKDALDGIVRLFIVQDDSDINKTAIEDEIANMMANNTSDDKWANDNQNIKILTLEHRMAAKRGEFNDFFEPLYGISEFKTGLLDGTLSGISFFSKKILPLINSLKSEDQFAIAQIIKKYSPIVQAEDIKTSDSPLNDIQKANIAVSSLFSLWKDNSDPLLINILQNIVDNALFPIPDIFLPIISRNYNDLEEISIESNEILEVPDINPKIEAWKNALAVPFSQLESYVEYISDKSKFGTHQGIKGLQFPRVMVILDDNEARGFMFSYEKLLGAKAPTSTDKKNAREGQETTIDRTRRLFYVTCSRAQSSLAIVVYTKESDKVKEQIQKLNWFTESEIIDIG